MISSNTRLPQPYAEPAFTAEEVDMIAHAVHVAHSNGVGSTATKYAALGAKIAAWVDAKNGRAGLYRGNAPARDYCKGDEQ